MTNKVRSYSLYHLFDSRAPSAIRYVGITYRPARRLRDHKAGDYRDSYRARWVKSVQRGGGEIKMIVVRAGMIEADAVKAEVAEISRLRRAGAALVNSTAGGETHHDSDEARRNHAKAMARQRCTKIYELVRIETGEIVSGTLWDFYSVYGGEAGFRHLVTGKGHIARGFWLKGSPAHLAGCTKANKMRGPESEETKALRAAKAMKAGPRGGNRFKGVNKSKLGYFMAQAFMTYIGSFKTEEEAARAYDVEALAHYGEGCYLNFPCSVDKSIEQERKRKGE